MPSVSIRRLATRKGWLALGISAAVVAATVGTAAAAQGDSHNAAASAGQPTRNVIVLLRNQHTDLSITRGNKNSARMNAFRADQSGIETHAKSFGAKNLHGFSTVNAFAATMTSTQATELASDPSVAGVFPDLPVKRAPIETAAPAAHGGSKSATSANSQSCPTDPS